MDTRILPKTVRQLQRAEGFIELELPDQALAELDAIENSEPFEPASAVLRGEALAVHKRYAEAVEPLKKAVTMIPAPLNKRAWASLAECYRLWGRQELADLADLVVHEEFATPQSRAEAPIAVIRMPMVAEALNLSFNAIVAANRGGEQESL